MKEAGTAHWLAPNIGATNESGFAGLGAGRRDLDGFFIERGTATRFWSSAWLETSITAWEQPPATMRPSSAASFSGGGVVCVGSSKSSPSK